MSVADGMSGMEIADIEYPKSGNTYSDSFQLPGTSDVEFTASITPDPENNKMEVEYRTEGSLNLTFGDSIRDTLGGDVKNPLSVIAGVDTSGFERLNKAISRGRNLTSIKDPLTRRAIDQALSNFPVLNRGVDSVRDVADIRVRSINTQMTLGGTGDGFIANRFPDRERIGEDPATVNFSVPYQPIVFPDIPAIRDNINLDQSITFTFRVKTRDPVANWILNFTGEDVTAEVGVPLEAFIGFASLNIDREGLFGCLELASNRQRLQNFSQDIPKRIRTLRSNAENFPQTIVERIQSREFSNPREFVSSIRDVNLRDLTEQDIRQELQDIKPINADPIIEEVIEGGGNIRDIDPEDLLGDALVAGNGTPQSVEDTAMRVVSNVLSPIQEISKDVADFEEEIRDQFGENNECINQFMEEVERFRSTLSDIVQSIADRASISTGGLDIPEVPSLDCSDVSNRVRNRVSEIEDRYNNARRRDVGPEFLQSLRSDAEDALDEVRDEVGSNNPCKNQLESRVRSALEGSQRIRPVLDCTDVDDDIRDGVDNLISEARDFEGTSPFDRSQNVRDRLRSRVSRLKDDVQDDVRDENPCKRELLGKIEEAQEILEPLRIVDRSELPCSSRFPEARDALDELESLSDRSRANLSEIGQGGVEDQIMETRDIIISNASGECLDEMLGQLEENSRVIENKIDGLRISGNIASQARKRRQEILGEIRSRVQEGADQIEIPEGLGGNGEVNFDFEDLPDDFNGDFDGVDSPSE